MNNDIEKQKESSWILKPHFEELLRNTISELGLIARFAIDSAKWFFRPPTRFGEIIKHSEFIGNKSVVIICLTGFFTGMVLSFQIFIGMRIVNAENLVGPTVALGIFRELGPVLTGLIVAARAGGAMAARIGTMRVTEEIDALEIMGVNPKQYLVAPRIVAATICAPLLTGIFDFVAMVGSYMLSIKVLGLDEAVFFDKINLWLEPTHINEGLFKAACFGFIFSVICTYRGYTTKNGAKGVGDATNSGVVQSMVMIIVSDYFLTNLIRLYLRAFE